MDRDFEQHLSSCTLCPRRCGTDRLGGGTGLCGAGRELRIHHWMIHQGEEPPISGRNGSGTIFFSGCPLSCVYCQNHKWSQARPIPGTVHTVEDLATICLALQDRGCHNINFVSPEPWIPFIVPAVRHARTTGLSIPIVWNTSGFISDEGFELIRDIVDIFLTDIRYMNPDEAHNLSGHRGYYHACRDSAMRMLDSVGHFRMSADGIGERGVIIRILILPGGISSARACLDFIARNLSTDTYISIMAQFEPVYRVMEDPHLGRTITYKELHDVISYADSLGFSYGWRQHLDSSDPEFLGTLMQSL